MRYLLDTDICSYAIKGHPEVIKKLLLHYGTCSVSAVTSYELLLGAKKNAKYTPLVTAFLAELNCLPVDSEAASQAATLQMQLSRGGKSIDLADTLIAATALAQGLTLVTNNMKHYEGIERLDLVNWAK